MEVTPRNWTPDRLGDLSGKMYLVTGGNSGIGIEAARLLASRHAHVLLACRNAGKAKAALEMLREEHGAACATFVQLDLADLENVRAAIGAVRERTDQLDGLINNAGIMMIPKTPTKDGFETQIGVNHLGHFALTAGLLELVDKAGGRVVNLSSIAHKFGRIDLDDLMGDQQYSPGRAYAQSKLANLLFTKELERRMWAGGKKAITVACHPGYSATNLQHVGPQMSGSKIQSFVMTLGNTLIAQSAEQGAWPTVFAAAGDEAEGGGYYGPSRLFEMRGPVNPAAVSARAKDTAMMEALWDRSVELTGARWPFKE